ncbi:AAA family ATPase [Actinoallomurus sp. NPDC052274]|uniref:AAA family ATPase n=1 Tax=Actinoallomurus sp. NPDC052274 TaxID=3155420 RepID=UPI003441A15D
MSTTTPASLAGIGTTAAPPGAPSATSAMEFAVRRTPTGRLGQGELRRQVAAHLLADPAKEYTPGQIATAVGARSAGAVANALETLVAGGHAQLTTAKPRRFRATATTAEATKSGPVPGRPHPAPPTPGAPSSRTASSGTGTPGAAAADASAVEAGGGVRRPNGQTYHPRALADLPDVTALRKLREAGVAALLYGPPGTGKTSLVEAAFPDLITVAGDGDTAVADFVGEYTQTSAGAYEFVYGPLVTAMTEGACLFIDDATLISPKVLAVVYPAMDGRRQITVKAHTGETITAADGFYVIAGHNPGVHGAVLTEALASRFAAQIKVSTDYDLARTLKIDHRVVRVARNLAAQVESGLIGWAPQLRELIAYQKITRVLGTDAAVANLIGIAPEEDRDEVAKVIATVYGRTIKPLALGRQL